MKLDYIVFFIVCWCVSAAPSRLWTTGSQGIRGQIKSSNQRETLISERIRLPDYTKAGYLDVNKTFGSDMYYIYYEGEHIPSLMSVVSVKACIHAFMPNR